MPTQGMTPHRYSTAGKASANAPMTHRIAPAFTSAIAPTVMAAAQRTGLRVPEPESPEGTQTEGAAAAAAAAVGSAKTPETPKTRLPEEPAQHWANQLRLGPAEARTGMILMEVLGEPVSRKRRIGRWR